MPRRREPRRGAVQVDGQWFLRASGKPGCSREFVRKMSRFSYILRVTALLGYNVRKTDRVSYMNQKKAATQASAGRGTTARLRLAISSRPAGDVFSTHDLLADGLGISRSALDVALKRLVDEGELRRAARGLFYVPERHAVLGDLPPKIEAVAATVARRTGDQVLPGGAEATNRLGLSTQVPARPVFYTTGRASRQHAGTRTIELRHRTAKLAHADPTVAMVIEALRSLGKRNAASIPVMRELKRSLTDAEKQRLAEQLHLAPGWMRPILRSVALSTRHSASTSSQA